MKLLLYLTFLLLLNLSANSQDKKPKYLDINLSHSLYSFDNYSYKISQKTHGHDYFSSFSPKLGLEYSFGKSTKFKHSVLFSYYKYTQSLTLDIPELFVGPTFNYFNDITSIIFFDQYKYSAISIEYRFSYFLTNKIDINLKIGVENSVLDNLNSHGGYNYYPREKHRIFKSGSQIQEYRLRKLHNSSKFIHSTLASFGVNYKINDNFQLLFSFDSKPFGYIIEEQDIKYINKEEEEHLSVDLYKRYINLSLGLKYRIKISKDMN